MYTIIAQCSRSQTEQRMNGDTFHNHTHILPDASGALGWVRNDEYAGLRPCLVVEVLS